jgi:hypothetical protein
MIQPADILKKAKNLYPEFLKAWAQGRTDFFPRLVPVSRAPDSDILRAAKEVQNLREGSKVARGFGYSVEWEEVNSRRYGKNLFPKRIYFESQDDFLRFTGMQREFAALVSAVNLLRESFPQLEAWILSNLRTIISVQDDLPGLIAVARYFQENPRPNRFVRELPVSVDTKFIERRQAILRQWLDRLLPSHAIISDEEHFERRFGLRYAEPDLFLRFLDPMLQESLGFPCTMLSLPLSALMSLDVQDTKVIIVENRVNLMTLPDVRGFLGLGGLGRAVTLLRYVPWLVQCPIVYWGDIDVDGFEIAASLRRLYPQTKTLMMDEPTLMTYRSLAVSGNERTVAAPGNLNESELRAFEACIRENLRIEQERLPVPSSSSLIAIAGSDPVHLEREQIR